MQMKICRQHTTHTVTPEKQQQRLFFDKYPSTLDESITAQNATCKVCPLDSAVKFYIRYNTGTLKLVRTWKLLVKLLFYVMVQHKLKSFIHTHKSQVQVIKTKINRTDNRSQTSLSQLLNSLTNPWKKIRFGHLDMDMSRTRIHHPFAVSQGNTVYSACNTQIMGTHISNIGTRTEDLGIVLWKKSGQHSPTFAYF